MRLENFMAFLEVARCHSMTAASEYLYTTPQNISKLVRELEADLGSQLLVRAKGNLVLSEEGKMAYAVISEMMQKYQHLTTELAQKRENGREQEVMHILTTFAASEILHGLFNEMLLDMRNPQVEIIESDLNSILTKASGEESHADYIFLQMDQKTFKSYQQAFAKAYDLYVLEEEQLRVYMNRQSAYATKRSISLKQLEQLPLVGFSFGMEKEGCTYEIFAEDVGVKLQTILTSNKVKNWEIYLQANKAFVLATASVMESLQKSMSDELVSLPLREKAYTDLIMCRRRAKTKEHDRLGELINKVYAKTMVGIKP